MIYEVVGKDPKKISFFIWDIDGVWTLKDRLFPEVASQIAALAIHGIRQVGITGRDAGWLQKLFRSFENISARIWSGLGVKAREEPEGKSDHR